MRRALERGYQNLILALCCILLNLLLFVFLLLFAGIVGKGAGVRAGWVAPRNTGGYTFKYYYYYVSST